MINHLFQFFFLVDRFLSVLDDSFAGMAVFLLESVQFIPPVKQNKGAIAQLVEQRTENPCVPGSIPGGTTKKLFNFRKPLN